MDQRKLPLWMQPHDAREKVPEALREIFCGHAIVFAKLGGKRPDSNAGHYGRDLLEKIEELLRVHAAAAVCNIPQRRIVKKKNTSCHLAQW